MKDNLLEVKNLKKYYRLKGGMFSRKAYYVRAVDSVSLNIKRGETFGLVGESGCGKTTLSRLILRLCEPDDGEVRFEGDNLLKLSNDKMQTRRAEMQMIFQDPFESLNPRMTVGEIVASPFEIHKTLKGKAKIEKVKELLNLVGLNEDCINKYPHEFSGGQRQRIGIARAIALHPKLVICDEPVSALDVSIQAQILNLLCEIQESFGLTYMFISHNLSVVKFMSDRIGVMYLGKIVEIAECEELYENAMHPYTQALLSAVPTFNKGGKKERIILQGDPPSPINPPTGCRFYPRCKYSMPICDIVEPSLKPYKEKHYIACHNYNEKF
ncbi:ABC transporter ATP-binding protein [Tepidanaerobacter syntrophicus]|uniref:ABC transporter ATP-binding protein n=1 Tax=Tepidanaerobacter syntrophicus TaxID=224999 RepID=UPI001BD34507|nr:oligopeptide/dipeptide ABC transporter ATP-binding protein [Tepidanaerobacter syntrophicus]